MRTLSGGRSGPSFSSCRASPATRSLSKIGSGAMGVVYRGFDEELKRWVALKVATVEDATPDEVRRIRVEAESMARLTHRNIVKVYDVRDEGGSTVISMELIPDGSLRGSSRGAAETTSARSPR